MTSSLFEYAWMIPHLLALTVGLVLVIVNWSRYPLASLVALFGLALIAFSILSGFGMSIAMRSMQHDGDFQSIVKVSQTVGILRSFVDALGTVVLVFAVYAGRQTAASPSDIRSIPPIQKPYG